MKNNTTQTNASPATQGHEPAIHFHAGYGIWMTASAMRRDADETPARRIAGAADILAGRCMPTKRNSAARRRMLAA